MSLENTEEALGEFSVELPTDEDDYLGRQCPDEECEKYFKLTPGTGLPAPDVHFCPYCGATDSPDSFHTEAQVEYANSLAFKRVSDAIYEDFKSMEFSTDNGLIEFSLTVNRDTSPVLRKYDEEELETEVQCNFCSLRYAVYGVFAYCPDCGRHNSTQILKRNFSVVDRLLELADSEDDPDVQEALIAQALKQCVSACDAWGRELTSRYSRPRTFLREESPFRISRTLESESIRSSTTTSPLQSGKSLSIWFIGSFKSGTSSNTTWGRSTNPI